MDGNAPQFSINEQKPLNVYAKCPVTLNYLPVDEDVEAPDDAGDGDHVEGDGATELPPLHPRHVELLPLIQRLDLNIR